MKLIILCLDEANKPSPISEGVAEIRIDNQHFKGINLTTRHTQARRHHEWQQFMAWSTSWAGSYLALVSSSTRMPWRTHRGWLKHYPIVHPWSEVRYRPTHRHTKLLSLGILYVPYASVHFKCLFIRTQLTRSLIDTGGGYHLEFRIYDPDHSQPSHPVFSIFPNCPAQSPIMPTIRSFC
jgi:hypothetical protein